MENKASFKDFFVEWNDSFIIGFCDTMAGSHILIRSIWYLIIHIRMYWISKVFIIIGNGNSRLQISIDSNPSKNWWGPFPLPIYIWMRSLKTFFSLRLHYSQKKFPLGFTIWFPWRHSNMPENYPIKYGNRKMERAYS